jgi:hypothetical protein
MDGRMTFMVLCRQMHTAKPTYSFEVEIATDKLKRYKSPGTKQIIADMEQAGGNTLHS